MASLGLMVVSWLILLAYVAASIDTRQNGFFTQRRVGKDGRLFKVIKIRTMRLAPDVDTTVTSSDDPRITPLGRAFRRWKIDEVPQLINVLLGQMSLVGPRPDAPGYADALVGSDRIVLSIRPGITGPATVAFRREEDLLARQADAIAFNREVLFPAKTRMNRDYVVNYSFVNDLRYIVRTFARNGGAAEDG